MLTHPPPLPHAQAAAAGHAVAHAAPVLTPQHLHELVDAEARGRKIGRAVALARFDGWSVGGFGLLTLLFGLTDPSSLLLGGLMAVVAVIELRAAGSLRRLEPRAARTLGLNQIALGALLVAYAMWRMYREMTGAGAYAEVAATDARLAEMLKPVEDLTRLAAVGLYAGVVAFAFLAQGGMALFYFTRAKHVRHFLAHTPAWVVTVRSASGCA